MTNPVSATPSAQLPVPTSQLVDQNGVATPDFHRFLTGLYLRTGGGAGASTSDAQQVAEAALTAASLAGEEATQAQSTATSAEAAAAAAQSTADSAVTYAAQAGTVANQALATQLTASKNLSDLPSPPAARTAIGTPYVMFVMCVDVCVDGLTRFIPVLFPITIGANLAGCRTWCGVLPTADALFTVGYIRSGVQHTIGQIKFVHASTSSYMPVCDPINLVAGDVITLQCPSPPDATLAEVGISLRLTIT